MTGMIGADVDQLRSLAKQFTQSADRLEQSSSGLGRVIGAAAYWRGNDANQFRTQWRSQSTPSITAAVKTLRTAAEALTHNADEQEKASSAGGGSTGYAAALGVSVGSQAHHFSGAPQSTNNLWSNLKSFEKIENSSGYHVQRIEDGDGTVRYVVYITGTLASDGQSLQSNVPAALGMLDQKQVDRLKQLIQPPGSEVMLVGHSQGGMDAQNIAHAHVLNVKQVVTFGSPTRDDLDVPVVHMREQQDMVPFIVDAPADAAAIATRNPRVLGLSPYSHTAQDEFIQSAKQTFGHGGNDEYFVHDSTGTDSQTSDAHQDYSGVTKAYDNAVADGKMDGQNISNFYRGKVTDEFDIDVNGDAHRPPYQKEH